ncbi:MAG TPA: hypothetical protein VD994_17525 [Prosthecobacter sp.]|nr:hypothetical protein [Prosthecobacter sp.]
MSKHQAMARKIVDRIWQELNPAANVGGLAAVRRICEERIVEVLQDSQKPPYRVIQHGEEGHEKWHLELPDGVWAPVTFDEEALARRVCNLLNSVATGKLIGVLGDCPTCGGTRPTCCTCPDSDQPSYYVPADGTWSTR